MRRLHRVMKASGLAVLLVLVTATSAFALSTSTTGASGRISTPTTDTCPDHICLWATDTLTDGHCAQWQQEDPNNNFAWRWFGPQSCSGSENKVASFAPDGVYRICRTGVGNCGPAISVAFGFAIKSD